jgi:carboxymethylenebutenolidase
MIEREIDIPTSDGSMNAFITHPEEGGPHPAILFYMDAPGKREELHDMARRLGTAGYYVVLPNLYYRRVRDFAPGTGPDAMRIIFEHMATLTRPLILTDTAAMLHFIAQDPAAKPGKVGAVGYCMSGPFVFWAAEEHPERFGAAASIHGVALCTDAPDSPHRRADRITGELYVGCAETDAYIPDAMLRALEAHLKTTPVRHRMEWYPGTQHGFVFPDRAAMYDKPAAERHWERLHALFRRNLG